MLKSRDDLVNSYKESIAHDPGIVEVKSYINKWLEPLAEWYTHGEIVKLGKPVYGYAEKICIGRIVFDLTYRFKFIALEHNSFEISTSWGGNAGPSPMDDITAGQILLHEEQAWAAMFQSKG